MPEISERLNELTRQYYSSSGISFGSLNQTSQTFKHIHDYNYIPKYFYFHRIQDENELYLGVELEIDEGGKIDDNAKLVKDKLGHENVYCKHDDSLQKGFEIVTHPCTYEYHKTLPYKELFSNLTELKYRSHDVSTCGMHIHFNRNYFGKDKLTQDLCISKLLYIFEKYWDKIVLIARRDSNKYAQRFFLNENETILDMYAKSKNSNKYGVINLQHANTVEIRIFKGTLNYNTFINTLQFVKCIVNLTKDIDIYNIQSLTWENISKDFDENLLNYIKEREELKNKEKQEIKEKMNISTLDYVLRFESGSPVNIEFDSHYIWHCHDSLRPFGLDIASSRSTSTRRPHYNRSELNMIDINDMTIEQIQFKIKFIKEDMRRANNMEKQMLQRELQKYTNKLGELRRRN